jgi:hypothetical protein
VRHCATNSLKVVEKFPSNFGGSFFGIFTSATIGGNSAYGGVPEIMVSTIAPLLHLYNLPFVISMQVMPRLHMSAF